MTKTTKDGALPEHVHGANRERLRQRYRALPEQYYQGRTPVSPELWSQFLTQDGGQWDFWELCSGTASLSRQAQEDGLRVGPPIDFRYGWDLGYAPHQQLILEGMFHGGPQVLVIEPDCRLWGHAGQSLNPELRAAQSVEEEDYLNFVVLLIFSQIARGKHWVVEQPARSELFTVGPFKALTDLQPSQVFWHKLHQCQYGTRDFDNNLVKKETDLVASFVLPRCSQTCQGDHEHQVLRGRCRGAPGARTAMAARYPTALCAALVADITDELIRQGMREALAPTANLAVQEETGDNLPNSDQDCL